MLHGCRKQDRRNAFGKPGCVCLLSRQKPTTHSDLSGSLLQPRGAEKSQNESVVKPTTTMLWGRANYRPGAGYLSSELNCTAFLEWACYNQMAKPNSQMNQIIQNSLKFFSLWFMSMLLCFYYGYIWYSRIWHWVGGVFEDIFWKKSGNHLSFSILKSPPTPNAADSSDKATFLAKRLRDRV